jgi:hypothetical protein
MNTKSKLLYDWRSVSRSVCLGIEHPCGTCCLKFAFLSAICSVITQWSESRRPRGHTLLSHLRLLQPGGPGSRIYIPQEQGDPVLPPGTGFPFRHLLRLAGFFWSHVTTDGQSVCLGVEPTLWTFDQILLPLWRHITWRGPDISEEHIFSVVELEEWAKQRTNRNKVSS